MDTNTMKLNMNERNMKFEEMKKELIEQARACRTREEKLAFIKKNYIELTEEQMVMINGGGSDTEPQSRLGLLARFPSRIILRRVLARLFV